MSNKKLPANLHRDTLAVRAAEDKSQFGENDHRRHRPKSWLMEGVQKVEAVRFLERDEAIRRPPCDEFPWDGVGDVRPFQSLTKTIIEGVY